MSQNETMVLDAVKQSGYNGLTSAEARVLLDIPDGTANGCMSVLHRDGIIARLRERRGGRSVYVIHEFIGDRPVRAFKARSSDTVKARSAMDIVLELHSSKRISEADTRTLLTAILKDG